MLANPAPLSPRPGVIEIDTLTVTSRYLTRTHTVRVFLPPGYRDSDAGYGMLLANDGQDMEAVRLVPALERLYRDRVIAPIIVVAIHASDARAQEYGTAGVPNARGQGRDAANYDLFVMKEVLPLIRRRYRVRIGAAHSAVMGWSLGGLTAFDLAWRHPDVFGAVGVFSGSFWWRTDDSSVEARQASRIMHRRVRETRGRPRIRMWFEAGREDEAEDRDGNGVIDAIQDTRELMDELTARGYREGPDMRYVEVDGGHNPATWGRILPEFLAWAFAPVKPDR